MRAHLVHAPAQCLPIGPNNIKLLAGHLPVIIAIKAGKPVCCLSVIFLAGDQAVAVGIETLQDAVAHAVKPGLQNLLQFGLGHRAVAIGVKPVETGAAHIADLVLGYHSVGICIEPIEQTGTDCATAVVPDLTAFGQRRRADTDNHHAGGQKDQNLSTHRLSP